jgi:hypothetical protein
VPQSVTPPSGTAAGGNYTFTLADPRGYQDLGVLNVLVNNFLDGRHAFAVSLTIAFSAAFNGNRVIWAAARDLNEANSTDWHAVGTLSQ